VKISRSAIALAGAAFGFVVLAVSCGGGPPDVDKGAYVTANDVLLQRLSTYPGSSLAAEGDIATHAFGNDSITGYTTYVLYQVPLGTNGRQVLRYYFDSLGTLWRTCFQRMADEMPYVVSQVYELIGLPTPNPRDVVQAYGFSELGASLLVSMYGLADERSTFELLVDHAGTNFCRG
jgi:hypothetical protein